MVKVLPLEKNFLAIEKEFSKYENSQIVIIQAPLEKTVSYGKGTKNGPKAILEASHYVEFFDEELNKELCFEKGISTLPELKMSDLSIEKSLEEIYKTTKKVLDDGKFPVILGGEHTITQATFRAFHEKFKDISILQFDAHSDLRQEYEGTIYSHASVMARVAEFNKNIVQVGIRAQSKEEYDFIKANKIKTFYAREIFAKNRDELIKQILKSLKKTVYITFDVDGLDHSIMPATGTPEPGGLLWDEALEILKAVGKTKEIVGCDVVELAPSKYHPSSDFVAAKLTYKIMNYAFQNFK